MCTHQNRRCMQAQVLFSVKGLRQKPNHFSCVYFSVSLFLGFSSPSLTHWSTEGRCWYKADRTLWTPTETTRHHIVHKINKRCWSVSSQNPPLVVPVSSPYIRGGLPIDLWHSIVKKQLTDVIRICRKHAITVGYQVGSRKGCGERPHEWRLF